MNKIVLCTLLMLSSSLLVAMENNNNVKNKIKEIEQKIQKTTKIINEEIQTKIETAINDLNDLEKKNTDRFTRKDDDTGAGKPPQITNSWWLIGGLAALAGTYVVLNSLSTHSKSADEK